MKNNNFQRGVPTDPFAKKQTDVATCTYTIDVPDFTMNQPKQK